MRLIVTFPSSHAALAAERALLGAGLPVELIPVPRQIRSDCGFCLLADAGEPGSGPGRRRLQLLGACGAREQWQVIETEPDPSSPSSRKVKSYERYP
jgi:hypothetical protein